MKNLYMYVCTYILSMYVGYRSYSLLGKLPNVTFVVVENFVVIENESKMLLVSTQSNEYILSIIKCVQSFANEPVGI